MSSSFDSKISLGEKGAEQLLGAGDMLYMNGGKPQRVHAPFVSDSEVESIVSFLKNTYSSDYKIEFESLDNEDNYGNEDSMGEDPLYNKAVSIIQMDGKVSTKVIISKENFGIGYNRAAKNS